MLKYFSIDIESTSIETHNGDIIEFGAIFDDLDVLAPIESLPRFHCYFLPQEGVYVGQPYALSMHSKIFRRIANREEPFLYVSTNNFGNLFKKFALSVGAELSSDRVIINIAGKNPSFDIEWLEKKTDIKKHCKIRHRVVDPSILFLQKEDECVPGMGEIQKRLGLDDVVAHNSIDDAEIVVRMVRKMLVPIIK